MSEMYGVINGFYSCGQDRASELNTRISARNIPSHHLQAQFDIRPVPTKYELMPIFDRRAHASVPIQVKPTYNIGATFNPGTAMAPWSGFASNINDESKLRNQFFALQKAEQGKYIPSTKSDLYNSYVDPGRTQLEQPYPELFELPDLAHFNPNPHGIGNNFFDNCTRQQIRNIKPNCV